MILTNITVIQCDECPAVLVHKSEEPDDGQSKDWRLTQGRHLCPMCAQTVETPTTYLKAA